MTGKFLQIPKVFGNPDDLKSVRMIWKVSGWSEKCPNYLKSARMICKASGQSERCPNDLGNVQMMHKMCFTLFLHILPNKDSDSFFDWSKLLLKVSSFSDAETPNNYFWDLYTLIWTIQTLRRGKVIFKCIYALRVCWRHTMSHYLNSCNLSLPHCPWLNMKIPFKLKCGHFIVSKLCKTLLFWGCVTPPALSTIPMQLYIVFF